MIRRSSILGIFALLQPLLAAQLPETADRIVQYQISVRLDPESKQLEGQERLTWRNPSPQPVPDLWFHLYLNAFKNTRSTFFIESGGQLRGFRLAEGKWGWTRIRSLRLADGRDLSSVMKFEHPDDNNLDDQTVMRVALPEPVPPGGSVTLDISFLAQLPRVFARTGYSHDFFLVGQWFPKIGVYEPAGMRGRTEAGWNCHQFHASSEFYADFGEYDVRITLPERFVVGATGRLASQMKNPNGDITRTYRQADIHDFAWTASPHFIELKRWFRAGEQVSPKEYADVSALLGRTPDEVRLNDIEVTLLLQPEHLPQAERHFQSAFAAIKYYGLRYGRYPYPTLTIVDPGPGAIGAGGMEYPTFITAGTHFLLNRWPFDQIRMPEAVTIHEFGHNYWYGLVANNEFEEAWLDEGINSYSTGRVLERAYGTDGGMIRLLGLKIGEMEMIRMQNSPEQRFNTIASWAWKYTPLGAYGFYSYTKPELALRSLERLLGEQIMARIMRTYHEQFRFKHPSSDDFFKTASEVAGQDLRWFFDQTIRGSGILDYEIGSISSEKIRPAIGVFERGGKQVELEREAEEDKQAEAEKKGKKPKYESVVVVRRRGEVQCPVDVELKFEGQPPDRRHWDGLAPTVTYRITGPHRLEWASVDPDHKLELDVDWLNNSRRIAPDRKVQTKLACHWLFLIQNMIALVGL